MDYLWSLDMSHQAAVHCSPRTPRFFGAVAAMALSVAVAGQGTTEPAEGPPPSPWLSDQPGPATAATNGAADMDALMRRLDALERRNEALDTEVNELRQRDSERTLTTERADEIRSIVRDAMAESANYASLRGDVSTAGWNDGFFMRSADGRFLLRFGALMQSRYIFSAITQLPSNVIATNNPDSQQDREGFDMGPYSSLWLDGHLFSPDITYMVKGYWVNSNAAVINDQQSPPWYPLVGDAGGPIQLADAWVRIALDDQWSIRVGQYRSPYSRETLVADSNQLAVDRSVVDNHLGLWYTQGIELQSLTDDWSWRLSLDEGGNDNMVSGLELVGTVPQDRPWFTTDSDLSVTTRFEYKLAGGWDQFRQFTSPYGDETGMLLGLGFHYSVSKPFQTDTTDQTKYNEWTAVTADFSWMMGGASFFASGYWNYVHSDSAFLDGNFLGAVNTFDIPDASNIWGAVVQGSIYVSPKVETYARFEAAEADLGNLSGNQQAAQLWGDESTMTMLTLGVNWYLDGQDLKWTNDVGVNFTNLGPAWYDPQAGWRVSEDGEFVFRSCFQLSF